MELAGFLKDFLFLIGFATLFATLCHSLNIPSIVGFILSGILIGPYGAGIVSTLPGAEVISELGMVFLLFTIGLEFSLSTLRKNRRYVLGMGFFQVALTIGLSALIFNLFSGETWQQGIFMGFLLSLSSTAIVMKLLQESRELNSPYGNSATGILIFQDIAVIPMTLIIPLLAAKGASNITLDPIESLFWLSKVFGLIVGFIVATKFILPLALERVVKTRTRELFFLTVVFLCFGVAMAFEEVGLSVSLGAFFAGIMIAESPFGKNAASEILPWRDSLLGLFFASVGMLVDFRFVIEHFFEILLLVASVASLKFLIITGVCFLNRIPVRNALLAGMLLFQVGEFSFILAEEGISNQLMSKVQLQYFLSLSVISMILTPFVYKYLPSRIWSGETSRKALDQQKKQEINNDVLIIGYGIVGRRLAMELIKTGLTYQVLEQNISVVRKSKAQGIPIKYGDATREESLEAAGLFNSRIVVVAASGIQVTRAIVEKVKNLAPEATLIVRAQYSQQAENLMDILTENEILNTEELSAVEMVNRVNTSLINQ